MAWVKGRKVDSVRAVTRVGPDLTGPYRGLVMTLMPTLSPSPGPLPQGEYLSRSMCEQIGQSQNKSCSKAGVSGRQ